MKGTKPDYSHSMNPTDAKNLYSKFLNIARNKYESDKIFDGQFGGYMNVKIENDGPVTICLNTDDSEAKQKKNPNSNKSLKKQKKYSTKVNTNDLNEETDNLTADPLLQKLDKIIGMI